MFIFLCFIIIKIKFIYLLYIMGNQCPCSLQELDENFRHEVLIENEDRSSSLAGEGQDDQNLRHTLREDILPSSAKRKNSLLKFNIMVEGVDNDSHVGGDILSGK